MASVSKKNVKRTLQYLTAFIIVLGILFAFTNLKKFKNHFVSIDLTFFLVAVGCTFTVYLLEGIFTKLSLLVFDERLPLLSSLKYSFIINAFGYLVSLGGLTPFATQIYVLDHHDISPKIATLSRVLQFIFFNILFDLLLLVGFVALLIQREKGNIHLTAIIFAISLFFLLITGLYLAVFWKAFQKKASTLFVRFLNRIMRIFSKKFRIEEQWAKDFLNDFNVGFFKLIKKPGYFITLFIVTVVDWCFWLGVMYFCFSAFNYHIPVDFLIIGFSIGQIIGILSMIPGGAGTMEGSMAIVFVALGVPLETALSAIILFRISFYILPFFLSLPLYFSLQQKHKSIEKNA
ncbi:MAG TPA: flippase-like domain-containing protein [Spirochaetota bacterium]|nr:flippase-like domain-containing protein [Spirochaetota bacterium]